MRWTLSSLLRMIVAWDLGWLYPLAQLLQRELVHSGDLQLDLDRQMDRHKIYITIPVSLGLEVQGQFTIVDIMRLAGRSE